MADQYRNGIPRRKIGMIISMIAAIGENFELGKNNALLWHLPDDFQWFIRHTKEKTVVMGRNTMLSLGKPLKNRKNIVISSRNEEILEGFHYFSSLEEVIEHEKNLGTEELMIIGGGQLYRYALPLTQRIYLTKVLHTFDGADTFFPALEESEWVCQYSEFHEIDEKHHFAFEFQILEKKS